MYTLTDVTKNYQKGRRTITALRGLNLVIGDGEWLAIQGRTGHGKTTLLHLLGGLDRPSTGTVTFVGHDLSQLREAEVTRLRAESITCLWLEMFGAGTSGLKDGQSRVRANPRTRFTAW